MTGRLLARLLACVVLLAACAPSGMPTPVARPPQPGDMPSEEEFLAEVVRSRGFRDVFLPIVDPEFVTKDADHGIAPDETVVAVDLGVAAVCYPTNLLDAHEIVEHTVRGVHLLATW